MSVGEEDCRAWCAVERPSGQCRSQSRAHGTTVRAQVTRRQALRRGDSNRKGSGWRHKPKQICVKEVFYIKRVEQCLAPNNTIAVSISQSLVPGRVSPHDRRDRSLSSSSPPLVLSRGLSFPGLRGLTCTHLVAQLHSKPGEKASVSWPWNPNSIHPIVSIEKVLRAQ